MGGCRCVYRNCQSSTASNIGLHYFHFPVRDTQRCEQWILNARKPSFKTLDRDKLRNKVVCSLHFEERCFSNNKHDRLIHNAIPTLGNEDYQEEEELKEAHNIKKENNDCGIMLIPIDEDNTKFALPDVAFSGMSYTIYDDAVIPSENISYVINKNDDNDLILEKPQLKAIKRPTTKIKTIIKKIKIEPIHVESAEEKSSKMNAELQIINENEVENDVVLYSVSTNDGNVSVQPSAKDSKINSVICDYIKQNNCPIIPPSIIVPDNMTEGNISIKQKSDNEFTISVNSPETSDMTIESVHDSTSQSSLHSKKDKSINTELLSTNHDTFDQKYINMLEKHTKEIKHLKLLAHKQKKLNNYILGQKPLLKRKLDKKRVIGYLKNHLKPSLLAILKLELLPEDEIVLTDKEEKFITEFYTENSECYNLLRDKWKWNLPVAEKIDDNNESN